MLQPVLHFKVFFKQVSFNMTLCLFVPKQNITYLQRPIQISYSLPLVSLVKVMAICQYSQFWCLSLLLLFFRLQWLLYVIEFKGNKLGEIEWWIYQLLKEAMDKNQIVGRTGDCVCVCVCFIGVYGLLECQSVPPSYFCLIKYSPPTLRLEQGWYSCVIKKTNKGKVLYWGLCMNFSIPVNAN